MAANFKFSLPHGTLGWHCWPLDGDLAVESHWVAVSDTEKRPKHGFLRPKNA